MKWRRRMLAPGAGVLAILLAAPVQAGTLGYRGPKTFAVPKGLETRVTFWKRVYSEWKSTQAAFHDRDDMQVVFRVVDVSSLRASDSAPRALRKAARLAEREYLDGIAEEIREALKQLADPARPPLAKLPEATRKVHDAYAAVAPFAAQAKKAGKKGLPAALFAPRAAEPRSVRYQTGLRDRFRRAVVLSGRWMPMMESVMREKKLPVELARLPFVESMFVNHARSHVGASGLWQFMRRTARDFMRVNRYIDERGDPWAATKAAARLLKRNFRSLGSWPLALTAYNHGAAGVKRAVKAVGSDQIVDLVARYDGRNWGFASKNFYAEFLAALQVSNAAEKHFGKQKRDVPDRFDRVRLPAAMTLAAIAKRTGVSVDTLRYLNPGLRKRVRRSALALPKGFRVRVPEGKGEGLKAKPKAASKKKAPQAAAAEASLLPALTAERFAKLGGSKVTVLPDESLALFAQWCGQSVAAIRKTNALRKDPPAGSKIALQCGEVVLAEKRAAHHHGRLERYLRTRQLLEVKTHRVAAGESLWKVATQRYRIPFWVLWLYNLERDLTRVGAGTRLRVPVLADQSK